MKAQMAIAIFSMMFAASVAIADVTAQATTQCDGTTSTGLVPVTIIALSDGTYLVNDEKGGTNQSSDSSKLVLSGSPFFGCHGANIDLDLKAGTGTFKYKYNSGFEGGGCQTIKGSLANCQPSK